MHLTSSMSDLTIILSMNILMYIMCINHYNNVVLIKNESQDIVR